MRVYVLKNLLKQASTDESSEVSIWVGNEEVFVSDAYFCLGCKRVHILAQKIVDSNVTES